MAINSQPQHHSTLHNSATTLQKFLPVIPLKWGNQQLSNEPKIVPVQPLEPPECSSPPPAPTLALFGLYLWLFFAKSRSFVVLYLFYWPVYKHEILHSSIFNCNCYMLLCDANSHSLLSHSLLWMNTFSLWCGLNATKCQLQNAPKITKSSWEMPRIHSIHSE